MPDEASQAAGRLLLTNRRAIFVGGAARTIPWHQVREVLHQERDLVLLAKQPRHARPVPVQRVQRRACGRPLSPATLTTTHGRPEAGL